MCERMSADASMLADEVTKVRLVAGKSRYEGRVEVRHHGVWGTICDDSFNPTSCIVICKQLGHRYGCYFVTDRDF